MPNGSDSGFLYLAILALPFLLLGWLMYTQRKRAGAIAAMQAALSVGDEVVTTSGLYGTIVDLDDRVATLETGSGTLRFDRRAIGALAAEVK